jgi:hypothetical protein
MKNFKNNSETESYKVTFGNSVTSYSIYEGNNLQKALNYYVLNSLNLDANYQDDDSTFELELRKFVDDNQTGWNYKKDFSEDQLGLLKKVSKFNENETDEWIITGNYSENANLIEALSFKNQNPPFGGGINKNIRKQR